jgi:hypothetical protein
MTNKEKRSQLWHDFLLGMHQRAVRSVEDSEWVSWHDAAKQNYGETYTDIYKKYHSHIQDGKINE